LSYHFCCKGVKFNYGEEISARSSACKIVNLVFRIKIPDYNIDHSSGTFRKSLWLYLFLGMDFNPFIACKIANLMEMIGLAPIEVEILLCPSRRTQKIETDSGISSLKKLHLCKTFIYHNVLDFLLT
jgi:hypothetical protein